jgi:hypothetical protein
MNQADWKKCARSFARVVSACADVLWPIARRLQAKEHFKAAVAAVLGAEVSLGVGKPQAQRRTDSPQVVYGRLTANTGIALFQPTREWALAPGAPG